jgi:hypothetical protein
MAIDRQNPFELNRYAYVANNPVNFGDPSGYLAASVEYGYSSRQNSSIGIANLRVLPRYTPIAINTNYTTIEALAVWTTAIGVGDALGDLLWHWFLGLTYLLNAAQTVIDEIGRIVDIIDNIDFPPVIRPRPYPRPQPNPDEDEDRRRNPGVIIELGAGDYRNAIATKLRYPSSRVIATNRRSDWELGKEQSESGVPESDSAFVRFYEGWRRATLAGVEVGSNGPIENSDVLTLGIVADIVYAVSPYPQDAYYFGWVAANIASTDSGTMVVISSTEPSTNRRFVSRFQDVRRNSIFVETSGAPFGEGDPYWEGRGYTSQIYVVP